MRSPATLLSDALTLTKQHLGLFVGIYAVAVLATIASDLLAQVYVPVQRDGLVDFAAMSPWGVTLLVLATIVFIVLSVLSVLALLKAVTDPTTTTFASAYRYALAHFVPFLWLSLLVGFAVLGGLILLIIPGIIVLVWLIFAQFVFVREGKRGFDALRASRAYVRGKWWPVFWRYLAVFALVMLISVALGMVSGVLSGGAAYVSSVLANLVSVVLVPFMVVYLYLLYGEVRYAALVAQSDATPEPETPGVEHAASAPEEQPAASDVPAAR